MSIRPIDMQVLMPKSQNISKINQDMINRSENLLQQGYMTHKKVEKKKLKKVNTTEKKYKAEIKNKNNDENSKCIYNEKRKSNKDNSSKIDIKV